MGGEGGRRGASRGVAADSLFTAHRGRGHNETSEGVVGDGHPGLNHARLLSG